MVKETPETVVDFSKLDSSAKLEMFKEALKGDEFKDVDLVKELSITIPEPQVIEKAVQNKEAIEKLLKVNDETRGELRELGHKFQTESKMSDIEIKITERQEKQSKAMLSERITELEELDSDFPSEIVNNMDIPTEDKLIVALAMKEVAVRNSEAIKKIKTELDTASAELKDAKLAAPETVVDKSGADIVDSKMSEIGLETPKDPDKKKE